MKKTTLSATELKNKTAEILNLVAFGKITAVVERYGEPLVEISPLKSLKKPSDSDIETKLDRYFGAIRDFPEVSKRRYFRKRNLKL